MYFQVEIGAMIVKMQERIQKNIVEVVQIVYKSLLRKSDQRGLSDIFQQIHGCRVGRQREPCEDLKNESAKC